MSDNQNAEQKKIKVAWYENNREIIEPILFFLEQQNFKVRTVSSQEEKKQESEEESLKRIIQELIEFAPDIIIFDYRMPHFGGLEIYNQLKDTGQLGFFVPVFLTIWANDELTQEELNEAGIPLEAIYNKQIEPDSFASSLREYYCTRLKANDKTQMSNSDNK